ncbi:MAG: hypothetical protein ACI8T1_000029 [Verrucomicrobiales bacterium]|jgi:hypothetical protein
MTIYSSGVIQTARFHGDIAELVLVDGEHHGPTTDLAIVIQQRRDLTEIRRRDLKSLETARTGHRYPFHGPSLHRFVRLAKCIITVQKHNHSQEPAEYPAIHNLKN